MNRIKTGGRKRGTKNKECSEIRDSFQELINGSLDKLKDDLESLEPKDRIKAILDLSKFVLPTLKATELSSDDDENFKRVTINLGKGIDPDGEIDYSKLSDSALLEITNATNKDAKNGTDTN